MSTTEELRTASRALKAGPNPYVLLFHAEDPDGYATNHMIAVCNGAHADGRTDHYGCCEDCRFIGGYDKELAEGVAALLRSAPLLADLLTAIADQHARVPIDGVPIVATAEVVARVINGRAAVSSRRAET